MVRHLFEDHMTWLMFICMDWFLFWVYLTCQFGGQVVPWFYHLSCDLQKNYGGVTVVNCSISSHSQWAEASHFCVSFPDIFQEAGLPLWLRPYEVLVTSSYTALIETIPDTVFCLAAKAFCLLKYYVYNLMSYSSLGFYSCNQE